MHGRSAAFAASFRSLVPSSSRSLASWWPSSQLFGWRLAFRAIRCAPATAGTSLPDQERYPESRETGTKGQEQTALDHVTIRRVAHARRPPGDTAAMVTS